MKKKMIVAVVSLLVIAGATLITPHVFADQQKSQVNNEYFSTTFSLPHASPGFEGKLQEKLKKLSKIGSPYGVFYRVDRKVDLPANEITTDPYDIKPETKEIVADFGVFVRK